MDVGAFNSPTEGELNRCGPRAWVLGPLGFDSLLKNFLVRQVDSLLSFEGSHRGLPPIFAALPPFSLSLTRSPLRCLYKSLGCFPLYEVSASCFLIAEDFFNCLVHCGGDS
ncbi:hypothetical protein Salat_1371800 [Sesamum alatum]|uniref:Uncharacterized protein n=1 Tax=Sesamum alatum TaxID=300844 RepID=A0AAE2CL13_9LAMI|nr:hypothetical protein Salat_1371800 [Sesamum alatum]